MTQRTTKGKRRPKPDRPAGEDRRHPGRLPTGVAGLDTVLGGGLLERRVYLVKGPPGTGKTVLASQICLEHARAGEHCVFLTTMSESHGTLLENLRSFDFFDEEAVTRQMTFLSGYPVVEKGGASALADMLRRTMKRHRARVLVIDSLASIQEHCSGRDMKVFIRTLAAYCNLLNFTAILICPDDHREESTGVEMAADGILLLNQGTVDLRSVRTVEVQKFRGSAHLGGAHVFDITREGLTVHPRLEARLSTALPIAPEIRRKLAWGIEQLDEMLHGGIVAASTTALFGAPGAGKTLLGLNFLAQGAAEDEPGLYFGFYETPPRLVAKAEQIGLPFERLVEGGRIELLWQAPLEFPIDALAGRLLEAVERRNVKRLFIDGMDGFRTTAIFRSRLPRFFVALLNELRARGVTVVVAEETGLFTQANAEPKEDVSAIFESLILMRYVEHHSNLYRLLSILKVRESSYDSDVREFTITSKGVRLANSSRSAAAILKGRPGRPLQAPRTRRPTRRGSR